MICKKVILRNFTKFTRKHLCQRLFFNNIAEHLFPEHLRTTAYEKLKEQSYKYVKTNFEKP